MNKVIKERLKKEEDVIRDQYDYWLEQVEIEGKEVIQKDIDAMASGATYSLYLIYEGQRRPLYGKSIRNEEQSGL